MLCLIMALMSGETALGAGVFAVVVAALRLAERAVDRRSNGRRNGKDNQEPSAIADPGRAVVAELGESQRAIEQGRLCREHAERLATLETGHKKVAKDIGELRTDVSGMRVELHAMDKRMGLLLVKAGITEE